MTSIETPQVPTGNASRTCTAYDNLQDVMRWVFYQVVNKPTHILAARSALMAYEAVALQHDPAVTTFKGVPMLLDDDVPPDEMHFMRNGLVVGRIRNIS